MSDLNNKRLSLLHPILSIKAKKGIEQLKLQGVEILITQGLRTIQEQNDLYAQGRTKEGKIVTNAKGGYSWHNYGLAFDIVPLNSIGKADWNIDHESWKQSIKVFEGLGLEWGGRFKTFKDNPHFQMTYGLDMSRAREYAKLDGLKSLWQEINTLHELVNKPIC